MKFHTQRDMEMIKDTQRVLDRLHAGIAEEVPGQPGSYRAINIDPNTNPLIREAIEQEAIEKNQGKPWVHRR